MVPQVVDDALDRAAVEEVAIGVGQLRLEHPAYPPAGDRVRESQRKHADDRRQEVPEHRSVENITEQQSSESEIAESKIEGWCEVVADNAVSGFASAQGESNGNREPIRNDCHS